MFDSCPTCKGVDSLSQGWPPLPCPDCGGRGWLIPDELREVVAKAAFHAYFNKDESYELLDEEEWEHVADAVLAAVVAYQKERDDA